MTTIDQKRKENILLFMMNRTTIWHIDWATELNPVFLMQFWVCYQVTPEREEKKNNSRYKKLLKK